LNTQLSSNCQGKISAKVFEGLKLFNLGLYFEAHEALETAWRDESDPLRELYRGILQVAVVYLHITRRNYFGALKVYRRCRKWLQPWPENCLGIEIGQLRDDLEDAVSKLKELGENHIAEFDISSFQPIKYDRSKVGD
jgi:uncharacterized protein